MWEGFDQHLLTHLVAEVGKLLYLKPSQRGVLGLDLRQGLLTIEPGEGDVVQQFVDSHMDPWSWTICFSFCEISQSLPDLKTITMEVNLD